MELKKVSNQLLTAACNAEYEAADWRGEFLAFGAADLVHVYHVPGIKTLCAVKGHSGRVNNVKFLPSGDILSICAEGMICLFRNEKFNTLSSQEFIKDPSCWNSWKMVTSLHLKKRNLLQFSIMPKGDKFIGAFLSTESDIHLVNIDPINSKFELIDKLIFGNNLLESSTLFTFAGVDYMFVSSSDFQVHVYSLECTSAANPNKDGASFKFLNSLKGHEDKVKCLSTFVGSGIDGKPVALVASGSKDNSIRVWRISEVLSDKVQKELIKKNIYKIGSHYIHLESILHSHSDSVSSVHWCTEKGDKEEDLVLLSSSFDFSVQVWQREQQSKVWMNVVRLGQLGGNKNSFFGARFSADCKRIAAYTFTGCFYIWNQKGSIRDWEGQPTITGHCRTVTDVDWGNRGVTLLSTSHDQTSRIYCKWDNPIVHQKTWHEVSRAQVHGYDINSVAFLKLKDSQNSSDRPNFCDLIVCGADEKILRVLEPPAPFVNTVNSFTDAKLRLYFPKPEDEAPILEDKERFIYKTKTEGGYSVLGLMIKATPAEKISYYYKEEDEDVEDMENNFDIPYDYKTPPMEDFLFKHTLWPEVNKLYGHGYEIVSVVAHPTARLIASCCKSQTAEHSTIFLWNPDTCKIVQKLSGHNYTVLQLRFSSTGKYLAAVSRDRQTSVYRQNESGSYDNIFLDTTCTKLINSVAITYDEKVIAIGSRDKTLKTYEIQDSGLKELATVKYDDSIKSLEFSPTLIQGHHILWVGGEKGAIRLFSMGSDGHPTQFGQLEGHWNHSGPITAIRCGPKYPDRDAFSVASSGEDHTVRIYEYLF